MSPFGSFGAICAHYGWTLNYLLDGIPWGVVERMMIDAPSYKPAKPDANPKPKGKPLTSDYMDQLALRLNNQ